MLAYEHEHAARENNFELLVDNLARRTLKILQRTRPRHARTRTAATAHRCTQMCADKRKRAQT
eukprot:10974509-Lingulodinium_polyedra.AAC.1